MSEDQDFPVPNVQEPPPNSGDGVGADSGERPASKDRSGSEEQHNLIKTRASSAGKHVEPKVRWWHRKTTPVVRDLLDPVVYLDRYGKAHVFRLTSISSSYGGVDIQLTPDNDMRRAWGQ